MLQCIKLVYSNQKVFTMGFSNQPLVILALVLIAYGCLLATSQVNHISHQRVIFKITFCLQIVPEIYQNHCNGCVCKDLMNPDATGVIFLLAGLVLLSTVKQSCKVFVW